VSFVGRTVKPINQTPPVVPSVVPSEPTTALTEQPAPAEVPVPVVAPATVEQPPATTEASVPVIVTYENCAAVWLP